MSFGDFIRSGITPGIEPYGVGGDSSVIWHCDISAGRVYELKTSDFSAVQTVGAPGGGAFGIGGDNSIVWYCSDASNKVYELKTSDLSSMREALSPSTKPAGIGGSSSVIWHYDTTVEQVYELSTSDFSPVQTVGAQAGVAGGIGGNANNVWYCRANPDDIYELNPLGLSVKRTDSSTPGSYPSGIGGDSSVIWHCDNSADKVYKLDPANIYTLSGTISDEFGNHIRDAAITISNGTTYTTTSDENGDYSKVVNSDTYDIAVSKSRSRYHDITESSVAVTADTTQDITMLTDKMLGGPATVNGMSIPGGISMGRSRK